ncbi:unnamed protein product, partial [Pylaiella littoralis]
MRSLWLAGVATASSLSSAAGGMSTPLTAAASASASCVLRGLGSTLPRTRYVPSRRSRSSTAAASRAAAFVMPPPSYSTTTKTSTWVSTAAATRGRQRQQHASTSAPAMTTTTMATTMTTTTTMAVAGTRRPRVAAFSSISGEAVAGAVGVGSRPSSQQRRMMMSSEAAAAAAAVQGGDHAAPVPALENQGRVEGEEE